MNQVHEWVTKSLSNVHTTTHSTVSISFCCCSTTFCCCSFCVADVDGAADEVLLNLAYFSSKDVRTLREVFSSLHDSFSPLSSSSRLMISLKSASKLPGVWKRNQSGSLKTSTIFTLFFKCYIKVYITTWPIVKCTAVIWLHPPSKKHPLLKSTPPWVCPLLTRVPIMKWPNLINDMI